MPDYPHHAETIAAMGIPKAPYLGPGDDDTPDTNPDKSERPDEHQPIDGVTKDWNTRESKA